MSTLGQYVHLHWENYEKAGTYETTSKVNFNRNNFQQNIFTTHKKIIAKQSKALKQTSLKALEEEYNAANDKAYKQLLNKTLKDTEVMRALLQLVNKQWSDEQIDIILQKLEWNNKTQRLQYKGKGLSGYSPKTSQGGLFYHLDESQSHNIKSTYSRLNKMVENADELFGEDQQLRTKLKELQKGLLSLQEGQLKKLKISKNIINWNEAEASMHGRILASNSAVEAEFIKNYNSFIDLMLSSSQINEQLAYRIPEILGNIASQGIKSITKDVLKEAIVNAGSLTTTSLADKSKGVTLFIKQDQVVLEQLFNDETNPFKTEIIQTKEGNSISYKIRSLGEGRAQKADIEFIAKTQNNKKIGISMKSTKLNQFSTPEIALQNSSLLLYLLGLQTVKANLGNHYLNILADHEDTDGVYNTMRNQANDALTLAIAFSALTGMNQARAGGSASVFAIYEKGAINSENKEPRVKLFDMGVIMEQLMINPSQGILLNPAIETISLVNTKITGSEKTRILSRKRITKLLVDARSRTIKATIEKNFLMNLRNSKT